MDKENEMLPLVVEYLKTHTFAQLEDEHGVTHRLSNDRHKASLNYDSIICRSGERLSGECRGLVVTVRDNYVDGEVVGDVNVLARPMDRFYNHGDPSGAPVDFDDPELAVLEKLDGTMCELYHDGREWCVATRSMPDADLPIKQDHITIGNMTFAGLFWQALNITSRGRSVDMLKHCDVDVTYVFELTSPYNRVIVAYDQPMVTLLTARNRITGIESYPEDVYGYVNTPKRYNAKNIDDLIAFVNDHDPTTLEGVVVIDSKHRRLKVKSFNWCFASKTKFELTATRRNMVRLILSKKLDDIAPNLDDEINDALKKMQSQIVAYARELDEKFAEFHELAAGDRKAFALSVNASTDVWRTVMFALYTGNVPSALRWFEHNMANGSSKTFVDQLLKAIDRPQENA